MQETWVRSLGGENPLGEETATHSTILAGTFRGAWWATVQRVTKSQTWLNTHTHTHSSCGAWAPYAQASGVVVHGLSYLKAWLTFQDQGLNPCPLHWQVNS